MDRRERGPADANAIHRAAVDPFLGSPATEVLDQVEGGQDQVRDRPSKRVHAHPPLPE